MNRQKSAPVINVGTANTHSSALRPGWQEGEKEQDERNSSEKRRDACRKQQQSGEKERSRKARRRASEGTDYQTLGRKAQGREEAALAGGGKFALHRRTIRMARWFTGMQDQPLPSMAPCYPAKALTTAYPSHLPAKHWRHRVSLMCF